MPADANFIENLLWNTLFYHAVLQPNFSQKETVMQLLFLQHVVGNKINLNSETTAKLLLQAQVVLPAILFDESTTTDSATDIAKLKSDNNTTVQKPQDMLQFQNLSKANVNLNKLQNLKSALQKAQKKHQKEFQTEYTQQYNEFKLKNIDPVLRQYEADKEELRQKFCSIQRPRTAYDAKNPCTQPPEPQMPQLPVFEFSFRDETDMNFLRKYVLDNNLETLQQFAQPSTTFDNVDLKGLVSENDPPEWFEPSTTLDEIIADIDSDILQNQQIVVQNTTLDLTNATYIVGGISVPAFIADTQPNFSTIVCAEPYFNGNGLQSVQFDATIKVPDSSWQLKRVTTTLTDKVDGVDELFSSGVFVPQRTGNIIFLDGLFIDKNFPIAKFQNGIYDFQIEFEFDNASILFYKINFWSTFVCNEKIISTANATTTPAVSNNRFIPSGFGVKQLGIADYKKIDQTLHGYVEGEVAHIENIMARERREKSTKKATINEIFESEIVNTEKEQISDTASTKRFEMQNEVSQVLQESKDMAAGANATYSGYGVSVGVAGTMATHTAKDESNKQAITQAQEITSKATDRLTSKVQKERTTKMVESFEEQNIHEFDNRKGDRHIVGVYRFVDKVYKNQMFNYGKRMMFEFMIPEPARLHLFGMRQKTATGELLIRPQDPRLYVDLNGTPLDEQKSLKNASSVSKTSAIHWGSIFNVKLEAEPDEKITIGTTFFYKATEIQTNFYERAAESIELEIPTGYETFRAAAIAVRTDDGGISPAKMLAGNVEVNSALQFIAKFREKIPVSYCQLGYLASSVNFTIECQRTAESYNQWQQTTFKTIIDAYEKQLVEYNNKLSAELAKGARIATENPAFYRQTENLILRKNCISYLIDQKQNATQTYGKDFSNQNNTFGTYEILPTKQLDDYAALAKFLEQAFEWNIMSYNFYPFYWGNRDNWAVAYQTDNNDALFRNFLQAGMARVVVTVNPGFEKAVGWYLQTGQIWNGGEIPLIEDDLFMAIVDELAQPVGLKEGKAWPSRVPKAMTILQADSIGLKVEKALPYNSDTSDFEFPNEVPAQGNFQISYAQMNSESNATLIEFTFQKMDNGSDLTIGTLDNRGDFPRIYECMGKVISINRDAMWTSNTPSIVIFEELASQISALTKVKARVHIDDNGSTDGLTFAIDTSKTTEFSFRKPGNDPRFDFIQITFEDDIVKIAKHENYNNRIVDNNGANLDLQNAVNLFPISRFLV